jgi:hypothetical protein
LALSASAAVSAEFLLLAFLSCCRLPFVKMNREVKRSGYKYHLDESWVTRSRSSKGKSLVTSNLPPFRMTFYYSSQSKLLRGEVFLSCCLIEPTVTRDGTLGQDIRRGKSRPRQSHKRRTGRAGYEVSRGLLGSQQFLPSPA